MEFDFSSSGAGLALGAGSPTSLNLGVDQGFSVQRSSVGQCWCWPRRFSLDVPSVFPVDKQAPAGQSIAKEKPAAPPNLPHQTLGGRVVCILEGQCSPTPAPRTKNTSINNQESPGRKPLAQLDALYSVKHLIFILQTLDCVCFSPSKTNPLNSSLGRKDEV